MGIRNAYAAALPSPEWADMGSARLVVALLDVRDWARWLPEAMALLDAAETGRVERKRKPAEGEALALAYALHRLLLGHALGVDAADVPLWREQSGRPRVGEGAIHTSISHADAWVALAVSNAGPVGVDIEPLARLGMIAEIAGSLCHPQEAAALDGCEPGRRDRELLALWVRKEALLKAAGVGLSREMSTFLAPEGEVPLVVDGGGTTYLQMLDAGSHCIASVAGPPGTPMAQAWLVPSVHGQAGAW